MPAVDWTIVLCIIGGGVLAFQAGMNGTAGMVGGNSIFATWWSFFVGWIPLAIYWLASTHGGRDTNYHSAFVEAPWYAHYGGLMGTYYVLMICFLATRLGAATILSVAVGSQIATAVVFDHFGALGLDKREAGAGRIIGAVLTVLGVAIIMGVINTCINKIRGHSAPTTTAMEDGKAGLNHDEHGNNKLLESTSRPDTPSTLHSDEPNRVPTYDVVPVDAAPAPAPAHHSSLDWTLIFPILGGVALSLQAAMNGKLAQFSDGGWSAFWSFCMGLVVLTFMFLWSIRGQKWSFKVWINTVPRWVHWGGLFGAIYVLIITIVTPRLGATIVLGTSVCAQVVMAVICDHFAWVGLTRKRANWERLIGTVILIGGVVLITIF
ncbi:hypothetical protein DFS34DRAFT_600262 [Phlyctochytrium arcticum]|nr:hypothetical protein DFS34DRAFT_600262 [Phlyctochytrium arcticum]